MIDQTTLDSLVVLDVETTGLSPYAGDRVCEIGAVKIKKGKIVDSFHSLINPQRTISYGAYLVNGISQEMVDNALTFREIALDFLIFIEKHRIAAYNARFDISFVNSELARSGEHHEILNSASLDILIAARKYLPGLSSYSLPKVADYLHIKTETTHRALDDAVLAWHVLQELMKRTEKTSRAKPKSIGVI